MNILLAFKAEPDLGMLAEKDWGSAVGSGQAPDLSLVRVAAGLDEQAGAELILRACDEAPGHCLTALSIGDERASPALRLFAALGFTHPVLLQSAGALRFSPSRVAGYIAGWVRQNPQQLIVVGSQSGEGQNGQTGWLLAEMLGWRSLAGVSDFSLQDNIVRVTQEEGGVVRQWELALPAVLIVRNKGQIALRVPGMRQRLAATKCSITRVIPPDEAPAPLRCIQYARSETRRECVMVEGRTAEEKIQRLWDMHLRQRMT